MKSFTVLLLFLFNSLMGSLTWGKSSSFDSDWRFLKAEAPGAEQASYNDSPWRQLDVPHDWSIEGPFARTNKTGGAGAWLPSGVGWYRKHFTLSNDEQSKRVYIEFDGVMQNSEVWINGVSLGKRPNGYVSFGYDLTPHLKFGERTTNVLAVRVDTSAQPASRWYSGAGIYRHVRLRIVDVVHFDPGSTVVTTPFISSNSATVQISTRIINGSNERQRIKVRASVHGPPRSAPDGAYAVAGDSSVINIDPGASNEVSFEVRIPWSPRVWSVERPDLHLARLRVQTELITRDEETIFFGIRTAEFRSDSGFWMNGKNLKLKGVCLHHDGGAFGAAVPLAVWERRLTNLRELGVNAIRTAHNPVAPEFLDLCDRMGFLVMNEAFDCWTVRKNPHDYSRFFGEWSKTDLRDMVRRDRNHPSVILWSVGNEIRDTTKPELAKGILKGLVEVCHENDPTRPVTQALFRPNTSGDYTNGLADLLDVIGTNYRDQELLEAWRAKPERKIVGTEQGHAATDVAGVSRQSAALGAIFVGRDRLFGESRSWPRIGYAGGLLDRTAAIKPMAYERQSWWSEKPVVKIVRRIAPSDVLPDDPGWGGEERHTQVQFADWTPRNNEPHEENVEVYSNCELVELFLDGNSLGAKPINRDASPRVWKVAFKPGTLRAEGRNGADEVATDELRTAGRATKIVLTANARAISPTWDDVAFVTATITDENGVIVPRANQVVAFQVAGAGRIAAVDNGDNLSVEPFQANERRAYQGRCEAAVKAMAASGRLIVTASAPGLKSAAVEIELKGER